MESYVGEIAALTTAMLWTLSILAWTSAGKEVGALAVSFIRLLFAAVFLAVYGQAARGLALPSDATPLTWSLLGYSGIFGLCLADILRRVQAAAGHVQPIGNPIASIVGNAAIGPEPEL